MGALRDVIAAGNVADRPGAGHAGRLYAALDTGVMFRDNGATWDTIASLTPGVPVLRGPYVVDYTTIPTDGSTLDLWTPAVGDVLLHLFADWQTVTQWDSGSLFIGQNVDGNATPTALNVIAGASAGQIGHAAAGLDTVAQAAYASIMTNGAGNTFESSAYVFHSTDPVRIQLAQTGGTDPGAGHVELYALVAHAVAP